ncbi:MAG: acyl-CoA thioesterase [Candidatus Saccharimonadales bacterium]
MNNPLSEFQVVTELPVQWGDQDAFQHVNNTVYLRWCESGRIDYLMRTGLDGPTEQNPIGPILAAIHCNFRRPVTYPDQVRIGTRVTRLGRSSVTMEHVIVSQSQQAVAADASSTLVVFDYRGQASQPIPQEFREAIARIEGKAV